VRRDQHDCDARHQHAVPWLARVAVRTDHRSTSAANSNPDDTCDQQRGDARKLFPVTLCKVRATVVRVVRFRCSTDSMQSGEAAPASGVRGIIARAR
jgi:hypothetical protein